MECVRTLEMNILHRRYYYERTTLNTHVILNESFTYTERTACTTMHDLFSACPYKNDFFKYITTLCYIPLFYPMYTASENQGYDLFEMNKQKYRLHVCGTEKNSFQNT